MDVTNILGFSQVILETMGKIGKYLPSPRERNLLIDALLEKIEESQSPEKEIIYHATGLHTVGFGAFVLLLFVELSSIENIIGMIGKIIIELAIIFISFFPMLLIFCFGILSPMLGKSEKSLFIGRIAGFSGILLLIFLGTFSPTLVIIKIVTGQVSLNAIPFYQIIFLIGWFLYLLPMFIVVGYQEYNRIKISAINRFLEKNRIFASFCLTNREKIKGKISKIEKDKVVISGQKASTWINQKDILYLELFE